MITTTIGYLFMIGAFICVVYVLVEANGPYQYDWKTGIVPAIIFAAVPFALGLALVCR